MLRPQLLGVLLGVSCAAAAAAAERSPSRLNASPVVVDIALGPTCAGSGALALAQRESSTIWSRGGMELRWVPAAALPYAGPPSEWIVVQCAGGAPPGGRPGSARTMPIASIRFIDSRPTNTITLSLDNAMALLLHDEAASRGDGRGFAPLRELRLGRMLGRAIAHEVGHFVNESNAHTPRGLMRATHSVAALTGASLGPFAVEERHARGLEARRAAGLAADGYQF